MRGDMPGDMPGNVTAPTGTPHWPVAVAPVPLSTTRFHRGLLPELPPLPPPSPPPLPSPVEAAFGLLPSWLPKQPPPLLLLLRGD